jgi:hypothetical protein
MDLTVVAKLDLPPQDKERLSHTLNVFAALNLASRAAQAGLGGAGLPSTSLMLRAFNPSSVSCRL